LPAGSYINKGRAIYWNEDSNLGEEVLKKTNKNTFGTSSRKERKMNKILLLVWMVVSTLIVICHPAFTQSFPTDKGSTIIDGSFSFSNAGGELYERDGVKRTSIYLSPSLSYFVAPGLAFGGEVGLSGSFQEGSYNWTRWSAGPRLLYFIGGNNSKATVKGSTYPFFDATALYTQTTTEYTFKTTQQLSVEKTEKSTTFGTKVSFGLGICYMLSDTIGLTIKGGYTVENSKPEDKDSVRGNELFVYGGIITFLY
jgi:hypothetical protein